MVSIPSQGFRHAAALLLSTSVRRIAVDASPDTIAEALVTLARELVALAEDTHAAGDVRDWLLAEYVRTLEALPLTFDLDAVRQNGVRILDRVGVDTRPIDRRDLFLIYAPEDRLPIAAPLAVELTKRRVTVAFSEYELATPGQAASLLEHGLLHHRAGAVLVTVAFEKSQLLSQLIETERLRLIRNPASPSTLKDLVDWVKGGR